MNLGIKNKNVLITGASQNIGKSIAINMAREGCNIAICARNKEKLYDVVSKMKQYGGGYHSINIDLRSKKGPSQLIKELGLKNFIPDIVIHNLGGSLQITSQDFSREEFADVWQFNIGIAHEINKELIPNMIQNKWGRIIHVSSLAAKTAKGYVPYVSAKFALEGYVKAMSKLLSSENVIMSAIAPGLVELPNRFFTKMKYENPNEMNRFYDEHLPIRDMVKPEEIADVVCFLCSAQAKYMPGAIVPVDGGGS